MHYHQNIQHQIYFHVYVLSIISFILELYSPIDFDFEKGVSVKYILSFVIHFLLYFNIFIIIFIFIIIILLFFSTVKHLLCVSVSASIRVTENRKPRTKSLARGIQPHSRDRHCSLPA